MGVIQIDIDEEALAEAMERSGETTTEGAVNFALREYVAVERRVEAIYHYAEKAKDRDYDGWKRARDAAKQAYR